MDTVWVSWVTPPEAGGIQTFSPVPLSVKPSVPFPPPIQYAAVTAYEDSPEIRSYNDLCRKIHKTCGLYLREKLVETGFNCPKPEGGFLCFFPIWKILNRKSPVSLELKKFPIYAATFFENHNLATPSPEQVFTLLKTTLPFVWPIQTTPEDKNLLKRQKTETLNPAFCRKSLWKSGKIHRPILRNIWKQSNKKVQSLKQPLP